MNNYPNPDFYNITEFYDPDKRKNIRETLKIENDKYDRLQMDKYWKNFLLKDQKTDFTGFFDKNTCEKKN